MKATLIALSATAMISIGSITLADEQAQGPALLSDAEMDKVVAGETQPPGWSSDGFPGATNGNNPFGYDNPPGWGPEGFPGGPKGGPKK